MAAEPDVIWATALKYISLLYSIFPLYIHGTCCHTGRDSCVCSREVTGVCLQMFFYFGGRFYTLPLPQYVNNVTTCFYLVPVLLSRNKSDFNSGPIEPYGPWTWDFTWT